MLLNFHCGWGSYMLCRCVDIWCVCEELMVEPHPLVEVLQYSSLKVVMHSNYTMYWFLSWTATFMLTQCIVLWSQTVVMDTCCRRGASYSGEKVTWYPLFVLAWTTPWFHGVSCSSFPRLLTYSVTLTSASESISPIWMMPATNHTLWKQWPSDESTQLSAYKK